MRGFVIVVGDREVKLRESELRVLRAMRRNGGQATTRDLFYETKMDEAYLWEKVQYLMEVGLVVRVGRGRYRLTEEARHLQLPKKST